MRRYRFIVVAPPHQDQINWKRLLAGSFFALGLVLVVVAFLKPARSDVPSSASRTDQGASQPTPGIGETGTLTPTQSLIDMSSASVVPITVLPPTPTSVPQPPTATPSPIPPTPTHRASPTPSPVLSPTPGEETPGDTAETPTETPEMSTEEPAPEDNQEDGGNQGETPRPTDTPTPETDANEATSTPTPTSTVSSAATSTPSRTPTPTTNPDATDTPVPTSIADPSGIKIFGVSLLDDPSANAIDKADEADVSWARYDAIEWDVVEANEGTYDWSTLEGVEEDLKRLKEKGITPIVVIRGTPDWAKKSSSTTCDPAISDDALDQFADFVGEVVNRYKGSPYNVKYWQLGNEPDRDPDDVSEDMPQGWCWGDKGTAGYGGSAYADMLKEVYTKIKSTDSSARVILGGLRLECDPQEDSSCNSADFFDGVLENNGGSFFDIVAFHSPSIWNADREDWDLNDEKWSERGGAFLGRLDFIKDMMSDYGITKPILADSIGLVCDTSDPDCVDDDMMEGQANYAIRTHARAYAKDLTGTAWYPMNSNEEQAASLLDGADSPRIPYDTLKFLNSLLKDTSFNRQISSGTNEGYAFRNGSLEYQIYWVNDDSTFELSIPRGTVVVYDYTGEEIDKDWESETNLTVEFEPVILKVEL